MSDDDGRIVVITFTETIEYEWSGDLGEAAKALGISKKRVLAILDEGDELPEATEALQKRLRRDADEGSQEWTFDSIEEG